MTHTLITGSTSGIGLELAKVFARENHNLLLHGRNEKKLNQLKSSLQGEYPNINIRSIAVDLSQPEAAKKIYSYAQKQKLAIDILVNNAGFGDFGPFHKSQLGKQTHMVAVNITSLMELTHHFTKHMVKAKKGKVLNLASVAAFMPGPYMSVYYATKAFVLHFSEAIAHELKPYGITVTALCPGATESNFQNTANMTHSKLVSSGGIPSSQEVAEYGYTQLMKGSMVSIHKLKNKLMILPARIFPRGLVSSIVSKVQSEHR